MNPDYQTSGIDNGFKSSRLVKIGEIFFIFLSAFLLIVLLNPFVIGKPVLKQALVWLANMLMLFMIWASLRWRGEKWEKFGLTFNSISFREGIKVILLSLLVFVIAVAGFMIGSVIMANITGIPESSNLSGYDYLRNNFGMLLLTLGGVYIVSSFGEEVIYRAFLINRITEIGGNTRLGGIVAVMLSSIIFGLVHYEWGLMGIVQTGFMGLALAICYIKLNKRLWILILAHAYMDTILMLQLFLSGK